MKKIIQNFYFILFFVSCLQVSAQTIDYKEQAAKENSNFYEIVNTTRKQFIEKEQLSKGVESRSNKKARKQFERWVWAWKDKINSDGTFSKNSINKKEYIELLLSSSNTKSKTSSTTKAWQQIGPVVTPEVNGYAAYPGMGRINVVAVQADNTLIMYAGSAAGGLWKTIDGGTNWSPKTDDFAGLGVTDIIIDPNNASIIYIATGDEDAEHISSIGLFKSTDAGDTWAATGLTFSLSDNEYIRDISFAPGSSTTIFALTNQKVKKSTDSGATWADMTHSPVYNNGKYQSIVFDSNDATKVVVSDIWGGVWYSSNSGANFTEHAVLQGPGALNKLKLTTSANDPAHFYGILAETRDKNNNAITTEAKFKKFRFANDNTAADLVSETLITGFNSQQGYNQCIAVSPTDKNSIIIGGVKSYISTDNGASFALFTNPYNEPVGVGFYVHPDHHHLSFLPDGVTVINGHDGGIHRGLITDTTGANWTDLSNGLIISQPYNIAITQGINGDDYMMANQDNDGFSKVLKDGAQKWVSAYAGDGTATGIDIGNPAIRYLGGTYGSLSKTTDGYSSSFNSATEILAADQANAAFVSPLALHPTDPATIYVGHGDVKMSTDRGANWTTIAAGLKATEFLDVSLFASTGLTRIFAIGRVGNNVLTLKRSFNNGAGWDLIASPASTFINSVYAVKNSDIVYATTNQYIAGKKVYKSTGNGTNWVNISGNLPNIIMYKIILDPNKSNETLYAATELGLYFTDNTSPENAKIWTKLGTGLPNVRISDIKISKDNGNVYVGTFGRGMWVYNDQKYFDNITNSNWSETDNWEGKSLPTATDDVFLKATENVILNTDGAVAKSLEIEDNATLTIEKLRDLTVENDFTSSSTNRVVTIQSDADDSGVLIVKGNATGIVKYERGGLIPNKWSVISSPVIGQKVKDFAEDGNNRIRINTTPDPDRYAIAKYNDANAIGSKWEYFDVNVGEAVEFETGIGYSMSTTVNPPPSQNKAPSPANTVSFTGKVRTLVVSFPVENDKWVAVGNPYSTYYPANKRDTGTLDFITNNQNVFATDAVGVYIWEDDQNKYVLYSDVASSTQKVLAPGQGFFIKVRPQETGGRGKRSTESLNYQSANRGTKASLTGDHTFNRDSNATPYIKVYVAKGAIKVNTDVLFSENATIGFDEGQDFINFGQSEFDLTTKLLDNQSDKEYTIQSIPKDDYENQIVPLNLRGKANDEITFSAMTQNLPEGMKVFLEDKETSLLYELSDTKNHTLTLSNDTTSFGRFYIRFSRQALSLNDSDVTEIHIYNQHNFLQIKGANSGSLKIDLFDISGKNIFNQSQNAAKFNPVDLNSFSKGVYLVKVTSEDKTATKKIIIN